MKVKGNSEQLYGQGFSDKLGTGEKIVARLALASMDAANRAVANGSIATASGTGMHCNLRILSG